VFYYSGHSDERGLLLEGERIDYRDLRKLVQSVPADVRIAVLDSCASGAFTRTKGGTKRAPFLVGPAAEVKGHAFLTSSSMDEAAQESDRVGGSFFTHYFTTGLRGAADVDGDRLVTLTEAYEFAFDETLARTEATRGGAQHAAYDIQLAGTGDLVMTDLRETSARLLITAEVGGRISVRNSEGGLAAELFKPPGAAAVGLALEPGRYQVTVDDGQLLWRTELRVLSAQPVELTRDQLVRVRTEATVSRGDAPVRGSAAADEEYTHIPFDFGLLPPLSINGRDRSGKKIVNTFSGAVLWSRTDRIYGMAVAMGGSSVGGRMHGIQLAWGANLAEDVDGVQLANLFNHAGVLDGMQGGFVNHATRVERGLQAGMVNVVGGIRGAQVGLVNVGRHVTGAQVGLLNIAGRSDASLGLLSITRDGGVHPEVSVSDTAAINVGLRLPATFTYSLLDVGLQPGGGENGGGWQVGLGLGGRVHLPHALFLDIDLVNYAAFRGLRSLERPNLLSKVRLMFGWQAFERFSLFGGPTLNVMVEPDGVGPDMQLSARPGLYQFDGIDVRDETDGMRVRIWPGFVGGLRF